jgi:DNA-directed RNA polymerase specialized sigma24 family protein
MRRAWCELHRGLVRDLNRFKHQQGFREIRARQDALKPFTDPAALLAFQSGAGEDFVARNEVLRELCREAKSEGSTAETSLLVALLALWPGMDAIYGRLLRHFRSDPDELAAEIAAQMANGIRCVDLDQVSKIAATLLMNAERDIRRKLSGEWHAAGSRSDLTDEMPAPTHISVFGFAPDMGDADADTARLRQRLKPLVGRDVDLLLGVAVLGQTQHEAAVSLGLAPEAGRKRHQRAVQKLRKYLDA